MKYPEYQNILHIKANKVIDDHVTQNISPTMKEAERASYKVGFIDCKKEFAISKIIDALVDARDWINGDTVIKAELGSRKEAKESLVNRIEDSLEKAGVEL